MLASELKEQTEKKEKDSAELEKAASSSHDQQSASFTKTEDARRPARVD